MNRFADKMGQIRAISLLALIVTLCVAFCAFGAATLCGVAVDPVVWQRIVELFAGALTFLLGNYAGRPQVPEAPMKESPKPNPTQSGVPAS